MRHIADQESILITAEAVTLVAQIAQGGLRDAESLLDQLSLLPTEITVEQVWDLVGSVPERDLLELVNAIAQDDPEAVLDSTRRLMDRGREPLIVLQNLAGFYRDMLIAKTAPQRSDLVALTPSSWQQICDLTQALDLGLILSSQQHLRSSEIQLKNTTQPRLWLEVTLMGLLPSAAPTSAIAQPSSPAQLRPTSSHKLVSPLQSNPSTPAAPAITPTAIPHSDAQSVSNQPKDSRNQNEPTDKADAIAQSQPEQIPQPSSSSSNLENTWQQVILQIQPYSTQVMVRQQCHLVGFDGEQARLAVSTQPLFKMAQGKLPNIEVAFEQVFGQKIRISLEVAAPGTRMTAPPPAPPPPPPAKPEPPQPKPQSDPSKPPQSQAFEPSRTPSQTPSEIETPNQSLEEVLGNEATPKNVEGSPIWKQDEVTDAANSLAGFFGGKVVDDDNSADAPIKSAIDVPEPEIEPEEPSPALLEEDDEDDLPF